mmetsp:Transcript_92804/g.203206  ORF Transcript_92804/g.203206 Transcript_92804/m.203206 type:complete len:257 (-) Transcript_92804:449-1219(-)
MLTMEEEVHRDACRSSRGLAALEVELGSNDWNSQLLRCIGCQGSGLLKVTLLFRCHEVLLQDVVDLGAVEDLISCKGLLVDVLDSLLLATRWCCKSDAAPGNELIEAKQEAFPSRVLNHGVDIVVPDFQIELGLGRHMKEVHDDLMREGHLVHAEHQVQLVPQIAALHKHAHRCGALGCDERHLIEGTALRVVDAELVGAAGLAHSDDHRGSAESLCLLTDHGPLPHAKDAAGRLGVGVASQLRALHPRASVLVQA